MKPLYRACSWPTFWAVGRAGIPVLLLAYPPVGGSLRLRAVSGWQKTRLSNKHVSSFWGGGRPYHLAFAGPERGRGPTSTGRDLVHTIPAIFVR